MHRICVFCGSSTGLHPDYRQAAEQTGQLLAERKIELVYGGARVGLMGALADAALRSGGRVIGVIPRHIEAREIAHRGLTELRVVETMHQRKALMADLSDGFIGLPGGLGTLDECFEMATWTQLGIQAKPLGLLNVRGYFDPLDRFLARAVDEGFLRAGHRALISLSDQPAALLSAFEAFRPPDTAK
jgi:uncharacterized protein (TIGR00730 family)